MQPVKIMYSNVYLNTLSAPSQLIMALAFIGPHSQQVATPSQITMNEREWSWENVYNIWVEFVSQICPCCMDCIYNWRPVREITMHHICMWSGRKDSIPLTMFSASICVWLCHLDNVPSKYKSFFAWAINRSPFITSHNSHSNKFMKDTFTHIALPDLKAWMEIESVVYKTNGLLLGRHAMHWDQPLVTKVTWIISALLSLGYMFE